MQNLEQHFDPAHLERISSLANLCVAAGGKAYLVGGSVRSALLKETVNDFDVEVFGLEPPVVESILRKISGIIKVGKSFGVYKLEKLPIDVGLPRRERKSGTGHRGFEVDIDPNMTLPEAARRRDFTINAIYYDIFEHRLEDPLGGIPDLQSRLLRHCSDRFPEDPLRVLRAMQFASRIPATVAEETIEMCRGLTPEGLSKERFYNEWEKLILMGKEPSRGLQFLQECGWLRFFPELEALVHCPQDPEWHPEGNVWIHTLHALDAFARKRIGDREEDLVVGLAVLCHDFGKPATTVSEDGRIRSPGHEKAGLRPTRSFLERLNIPGRIIEGILPLIKCHMRPTELHRQHSSQSAVRRLARDCGRLDRLLRVVEADASGRPPLPNDVGPSIEWVRDQAERLNVSQSGPKALLGGKDLIKRGWETGPQMGVFLKQAYEHQLDGKFTNREEALQWLKNQKVG